MFGVGEEDQPEDRAAVLIGGQGGVGAKLVGPLPTGSADVGKMAQNTLGSSRKRQFREEQPRLGPVCRRTARTD